MIRCLLAALLLPLCANALAAEDGLQAVPAFSARVTDLTQTLSDAQRGALEQKLAAFEATKGSQIAVLMVPTTQPEEIEQYSIRVVDAWKLGRAKVDDGALLIIAKNDRRMRIEVGRGIEGALPDAIAKRIIDETIKPHFRDGDFAGGIDAGVDQMMSVIQGEPLPPPRAQDGGGDNRIGALLLPFFLFWGFGHLLKKMFGSFPASGAVGLGTGVIASLIFGSLALAIGVGVVAMLFSLLLYSGAVGGLPMGYGGGRGGFGGGFGGGGFGGGGGGFGGGGASGGW